MAAEGTAQAYANTSVPALQQQIALLQQQVAWLQQEQVQGITWVRSNSHGCVSGDLVRLKMGLQWVTC